MSRCKVLSLANIHPDWLGAPGATLGSEAVRAAILANPRITRKLTNRLLYDFDLPIDDDDRLSAADRRALNLLFDDTARLADQLGLVCHGDYLATLIEGREVRPLAAQFPIDDLRRAVRLRHLSPVSSSANFDAARFAEIVRATGEQCVVAWATELPPGDQRRVMLLFSKHLMQEQAAIRQRLPEAAALVRALAEQVLAPAAEREVR